MKENPYHFPISKCPYCGGKEIVIKQYMHGYGEYYIDLETGDIDASELHSGLRYRNTGKYVICTDCGKRLFKVDNKLNVIK